MEGLLHFGEPLPLGVISHNLVIEGLLATGFGKRLGLLIESTRPRMPGSVERLNLLLMRFCRGPSSGSHA